MATIYESTEITTETTPDIPKVSTPETKSPIETPETPKNHNTTNEEIIIRQSYLLLVFRLAVGLLLMGIISLVIHIFAIPFTSSPATSGMSPGIRLGIILILIYAIIALIIYVRWRTTYYMLKKLSVVSCQGLLKTTQQTIKYSTFSGLRIEQGIFGKILNYGTIILEFEGREGSTEALTFFPKPYYYAEIIKKRIKNQ